MDMITRKFTTRSKINGMTVVSIKASAFQIVVYVGSE